MNYLIAKLKGAGGTFWRIMSQNLDIFTLPDLTNAQPFTPNYKLEDDECFLIKKFSKSPYKNPLIAAPFNSAAYKQLPANRYGEISYFCAKQGGFLLFQKLGLSQVITKHWFEISAQPVLQHEKPIIVLHQFADVAYDIANDNLYFRDFAKLKGIFAGIEELYREATQDEVKAFLGNGFLSVKPTFTATDVKPANRKRIAIAMDTIKKFKPNQTKKLFDYVHEYCKMVPVNGKAFVIDNEEHLKQVLYGIEQRYYTTPINAERRLANSIQTLP